MSWAEEFLGYEPWMCSLVNPGLSNAMKEKDYDGFMRLFSYEVRKMGKVDVEHITIKCEGQCPKGCDDKFKMKLGKSFTKKSWMKMNAHGQKNPMHCFVVNFDGVIKNGDLL